MSKLPSLECIYGSNFSNLYESDQANQTSSSTTELLSILGSVDQKLVSKKTFFLFYFDGFKKGHWRSLKRIRKPMAGTWN